MYDTYMNTEGGVPGVRTDTKRKRGRVSPDDFVVDRHMIKSFTFLGSKRMTLRRQDLQDR